MNTVQRQIITICTRLLSVGLLAFASLSLQAAVLGSKHDLSTSGTGQGAGGTDEVCVFCHTPHGSDNSAAVPLWNKALPTGTTYTRYSNLNTSSLDGTEAPVGSVSLACLSCHDGGQAMDLVINAPGSGDPLFDIAGTVDLGATGVVMANPGTDLVPMLGTDLSDDHPISIQYAGGGCDSTNSAVGETCIAALFADDDFNPADRATINTNAVWWVDTPAIGTDGTRERTDMQLYTRTNGGNTEPFVECGSCHDPHNGTTSTATSVDFLRVANTGSQICTACHIK